MSDSICAVCGAALVRPGAACRECHASPEWQDLFLASRVAAEQCKDLHEHRLLSDIELRRASETLASMRLRWSEQARRGMSPPSDSGLPPRLHCRECGRHSGSVPKFCGTCGGPTGARADRLRHMDFVLHLITHFIAVEMATEDAQRCVDELRDRIGRIEAELKSDAASQTLEDSAVSRASRSRSLVEILLDPQSIRWFLVSGGVLLAVGLVIFLSSVGVFENATVVASAMGLGTLGTLAGGIAMIRFTRHSFAGRATALLGCLVMPLNLWFYNANQLVTLDGHLWVAAMVCCALYAVVAFVLKDPTFVYVLFGGITMTGMLVLADMHRLVEISAPATLLVALGLISLHAERAFADDDGPFSRKRFGLACFWSSQGLVGVGLLLLLGSQVAAWVPGIWLESYRFELLKSNQFLALALVLAGSYAYAYSSLVVRRSSGIFGYLAVICLLWAEFLGIQIGHLTKHPAALLSALALTSLALNVASSIRSRTAADLPKPLAGPLAPFGIGLIVIALAIGSLPHLHSIFPGLSEMAPFAVTWNYVGAIVLTAVSSRIAASLNARSGERLSIAYHFATAGATFMSAAGLLMLVGLDAWSVEATALMAIPMVYLLASRFHGDGPAKSVLPRIAGAAVMVLIFSSLVVDTSQWINPTVGHATDLWLAAFSLEAAVFFAISAAIERRKDYVYFSAAMICGMVYQLLGFWQIPLLQTYSVAIAGVGIAGLVVHRFVDGESRGDASPARGLFVCANALLSLPMAAMTFVSLSRLALGNVDLAMLCTPVILSALALISAALVSAGGARRWYLTLTIGQAAVGLLALAQYSTLSLRRKGELFCVMTGLLLLVVGYGLWYRNQNDKSDGVGFCLSAGALLAGLPPAIFAIINRFGYEVSFADELALVTIAVLMFLTGMMSRVRATTLIGGGLLASHLITLVIFAGMEAQLAVGAYVTIGGAAFFVVGLLLSVYRDRLLEMPQRIKQRQGLFRVLAWR